MSDKKLLTEWMPFEYTPLMVEQSRTQNSGKIIMKGILQKANTLNQNGRIYPQDILAREIQNYQKFIKENRALGECDHPAASVVELKNASHIVRSARESRSFQEADLRKVFNRSDRVNRIFNEILVWEKQQ